MVYICLDCGNTERFNGNETGDCTYRSECIFDGDGCIEETTDTDYDDHNGEDTHIESCDECDSTNIKYMDDEDEAEKISEQIKNGTYVKPGTEPETLKRLLNEK